MNETTSIGNSQYHATGSNFFGQWCGCNDNIIQEFNIIQAPNTLCGNDLKHIELVHVGWSHNIYRCNGFFYITGDYKLSGLRTEMVKLPDGEWELSDCDIVSDDFRVVVYDKFKLVIWIVHLETQSVKSFHLSTEVPLCNKSKRLKHISWIVKCVAKNNNLLFLTNEGLVYSGTPPTLVDTSECMGQPRDIECGYGHCVLLTDAGKVYTWGEGRRLQLGHGDASCSETPALVRTIDEIAIKKIAAGGWHTVALSNMGNIYVWGWNDSGQLGVKDNDCNTSYAVPTWVDLFHEDGTRVREPVVDVSCGSKHTAILLSDNTLWTCGNNKYGQLGFSTEAHCRLLHFKKSSVFNNACKVICGQWSTVVKCVLD